MSSNPPAAGRQPSLIPYFWVAAGSALGGMGRYGFGLLAARLWGEAFPWGTIAINVMGSFVIGFFAALTMPDGVLPANANLRTFVMVGICGGFTTFSAFSLQTFSLARDGNWFGVVGNVALSVVLCLLAVTLGQVAADRIGAARTEATTMPRAILAFLDRVETAPSVLAASRFAADRLGPAQIEALHVRHDSLTGFMPTEDVMTGARRREIDGEAARQSAELQGILEAWRQRGGTGTWRETTGETARVIADNAANADLVVVGRWPPGHTGAARQALYAALFDARRLTMLVPEEVPTALGRHVAVAWKPSEAAETAVKATLPLLRRADRVTVLIGTEAAAPAPEPAPLLQSLVGAGVPVVVQRFQQTGRAIGETLLAEAHLAGADLLVMGAYTHSHLREIVLGGATRDILSSADLPVLLHH
jgi:protein CrcB